MESKSNEKSDLLRAEGNKFYSQKQFFDALLKYNESLCRAELETSSVGLAFANRSAVYFEMKVFDKCLHNIELAKLNNYPEKNLATIEKRGEKCLEMMKKKSKVDSRDFIKLSYPANQKLPYVVDCLELKQDKNYGRFIVTNRALNVGDILAIEEPFCRVLQERFIYQRCSGCFEDNFMDLIPCEKCGKGKKIIFQMFLIKLI